MKTNLPSLLIRFLKSFVLLALLTQCWISFAEKARSDESFVDPVEKVWAEARVRVDAEIPVYAPQKNIGITLRGTYTRAMLAQAISYQNDLLLGLQIEKRRLMNEAPVLNSRVPLFETEAGMNGVSPFGKIHRCWKTGKPGAWSYCFGEDKWIIVTGMVGNQHGARVLAGPFGDVTELTIPEVQKQFKFTPSCHPTKVLLLTQRPYADTGTGVLPVLPEFKLQD